MRLLRLTTQGPSCVFDNSFNADLNLPPKAKLALQNVTINKNIPTLLIPDDSAALSVQCSSSGPSISHPLARGRYTASSLDFLGELSRTLNRSVLLHDAPPAGKQFRCSLNADNKAQIELQQSKLGVDLTDIGKPNINRYVVENGLIDFDTNKHLSLASFAGGNGPSNYCLWKIPLTQPLSLIHI